MTAAAQLPVTRELSYEKFVEKVNAALVANGEESRSNLAKRLLTETELDEDARNQLMQRGLVDLSQKMRHAQNVDTGAHSWRPQLGLSGMRLDVFYGFERRYIDKDGIEKSLADFTYKDWKHLEERFAERARGLLTKIKVTKRVIKELAASGAETVRHLPKEKRVELESFLESMWTL